MHNVPNLITFVRLGLVPILAYCVVSRAYAAAAAIFLIAALSDLADGYIARRFKLVSRLGALLDPIADKLNMLVTTVLLAWQELLPIWLAIAIVVRDIAIVLGVLIYRFSGRNLEMKPTRLSKANTFLEFSVLVLVLVSAAHWIRLDAWLPLLFLIVLGTIIASTVQYAWLWTRGELALRRRSEGQ
ncbi:MAG TPA: CDP-alcohol phosphatidyltransferase family protein [Casimicrobiaceae bacterium]|nr:CDP-alcohol phosphatidyltransferase family protein [Casimicrobiaceae bacterium]